jgi:dolichol-phosphate mannosyltransferase
VALISIIIPVYFNASSLTGLQERLHRLALEHPQHRFEFIYVDDGSGDNSFEVMKTLALADSRVRAIRLARNFGSNTAILAGITHARGECVGFIAADLQDPPEALAEMIEHWQSGSKVVLAIRKDRHADPLATRLFSNLFNWLFKKLVYSGFSPQGVGFFIIDRQVAEVILACREKNAHLIGLILWSGFAYETVAYDRVEREHGKSRWNFSRKFKYFIDAFVAFSYLPLRLSSMLGLVLALFGGIYAFALIVLRLFNGITVEGWTTLMVVVLLLSGVQLLMLGVIGEYLWRNFDATRQRPLFIVESIYEKSEGE